MPVYVFKQIKHNMSEPHMNIPKQAQRLCISRHGILGSLCFNRLQFMAMNLRVTGISTKQPAPNPSSCFLLHIWSDPGNPRKKNMMFSSTWTWNLGPQFFWRNNLSLQNMSEYAYIQYNDSISPTNNFLEKSCQFWDGLSLILNYYLLWDVFSITWRCTYSKVAWNNGRHEEARGCLTRIMITILHQRHHQHQ